MRTMRRHTLILLFVLMTACRTDATEFIRIENQTYTPLHYRVRNSHGSYGAWASVLPGSTLHFANRDQVQMEVWFSKDRSESFGLKRGKSYVFYRDQPKGAPSFEAWDGPALALPELPGEPRDASTPQTAFAPLEAFVAQCREHKLSCRLSLRKLASDYEEARKGGSIPDEIRYLRGFTYFVGYLVDTESNDVILLGVKDPTRPPLDVDCLVTAIKSAFSGNTPFCSLEDHPNPAYQKSIVDGVPWQTRWAEVMIYADYDMKKLGQGHWNPGIPGFKSHTQHFQDVAASHGLTWNGVVEKSADGTDRALNRWWFNFDSAVSRAVADDTGKLVYLYRNPVRVSTEQALNGKFGTKKTMVSAQRFADGFTLHMEELGRHYPHIAELQALYRIYDLMRHLRDVGQTAPPGMLTWIRNYESPYEGPPEGMPTLTLSYKVQARNGYGHVTQTWDVRGGVVMRIGITRESLTRVGEEYVLRK